MADTFASGAGAVSAVAALGSSVIATTSASASVAAAHDGASSRRANLRPSGSTTVSSATTVPFGPASMRAVMVGIPTPSLTNRMRVERAATRATSSSRVEQLGAASTSSRATLASARAAAGAATSSAATR